MENTLHHVADDKTERRTMSRIDAVLESITKSFQ